MVIFEFFFPWLLWVLLSRLRSVLSISVHNTVSEALHLQYNLETALSWSPCMLFQGIYNSEPIIQNLVYSGCWRKIIKWHTIIQIRERFSLECKFSFRQATFFNNFSTEHTYTIVHLLSCLARLHQRRLTFGAQVTVISPVRHSRLS